MESLHLSGNKELFGGLVSIRKIFLSNRDNCNQSLHKRSIFYDEKDCDDTNHSYNNESLFKISPNVFDKLEQREIHRLKGDPLQPSPFHNLENAGESILFTRIVSHKEIVGDEEWKEQSE